MRQSLVLIDKKAQGQQLPSLFGHTAIRVNWDRALAVGVDSHSHPFHLATNTGFPALPVHEDGRRSNNVPARTPAPGTPVNYATPACPAFPRRCPFGGACHTCPVTVQAKLAINQPGDNFEQEADQMAERVMRMPKSSIPTTTTSSTKATPSAAPPIVREVLRSPGQPLDPATRTFFEPRFSHDFSRVRVHDDTKAAESARAVNALAYTAGQDVVLAADQYNPVNKVGRRLLAHELAHTIQQTRARPILYRAPTPELASAPEPTQASEPSEGLPESTIRDFCHPYASRQEARQVHNYMLTHFIPLDKQIFGPDVGALWENYLSRKHGDSLARRVISSGTILSGFDNRNGFENSETTMEHQRLLTKRIKAALPSECPILEPNKPTDFPVIKFLASTDLKEPINFNKPLEIPGHIAGGIGESAAGPDSREVSGKITLRRDVDTEGKTTGISLTTGFRFRVIDAIDFCPGDPGNSWEQGITTMLSRLEATGLFLQDEPFAYDVPFEVRYSGNPLAEEIDPEIVKQCFPDLVERAKPTPQPPAQPVPKPPPERPEERER